jgi:hypothetical protein
LPIKRSLRIVALDRIQKVDPAFWNSIILRKESAYEVLAEIQ